MPKSVWMAFVLHLFIVIPYLKKLSKLDGIVTSLRLLELFFDDVLVDMIVILSLIIKHASA